MKIHYHNNIKDDELCGMGCGKKAEFGVISGPGAINCVLVDARCKGCMEKFDYGTHIRHRSTLLNYLWFPLDGTWKKYPPRTSVECKADSHSFPSTIRLEEKGAEVCLFCHGAKE